MYKKMGEDTARTADSNWPKGHSIPYGIMLNNKTGKVGQERPISAQRLAGHHSASDEQLQCTSLGLHILLSLSLSLFFFLSFSVLLNYLNPLVLPFFQMSKVFSCLSCLYC